MDSPKLDQINFNLTGFFKDIVSFIQDLWETLKKFFKISEKDDPDQPLFKDEETTA